MTIKVFGNESQAIEDGQLFRAVKYTVEGRDVTELIPIEVKQ